MATPSITFFERECERVRREPPLSDDAERALAKRWVQRGDRAAAEALVRSALPVVLTLARRLRGYGVPRDELIAEGNLGLLRAVEKFDLRGVRFRTYATYWVRAYMFAAALRGHSMVTRATGAVGARFFFKLRAARARAEALLGPDPEAVEELLARQFGVEVDVIRAHSARLAQTDGSLDAPAALDGDATLLDLLPADQESPEEAAGRVQRDELVHRTLRRVWGGLDERERAIVTHRLLADGDDVTLATLGQKFRLSRERLRQVEVRLKARLRRTFEEQALALG